MRLLLPTVVALLALSQIAHADAIDAHPNAAELRACFATTRPVAPTDVTRADYLKLIAANVDHFKSCQDDAGRIIDPVSNGERQYSTPAFAAAAGCLVRESGRADLIEPASRALTCALTALLEHRAADNHSDFYAPLLVHAYRWLKDAVPAAQSKRWAEQFAQIDPTTAYRAELRAMNWNIVSTDGELLRRHDGLVATDRRDAQMAYLETCLAGHVPTMKPIGLFEDPAAPLAYDAFSRLWLEDAFADGAYDGPLASTYEDFLTTGGLSSLLMLSPTGEWPCGGRSALHNWNEAQLVAICEMNASRWHARGRDDVAGSFKRAAHLAFASIARWQRPGGELWIIKNRAEPETRFAYEKYSNHSQYNLLPMAMLAIAHDRADEAIAERPTPAEVGGYVFDARETFHKIIAAAGGYYAEIDTAADAHYNATGLQRVHRTGVPFPSLSDTAAADRAYEPNDAYRHAVALGLQWREAADQPWTGLAEFVNANVRPATTPTTMPTTRRATTGDLRVTQAAPDRVAFDVTYDCATDGAPTRTVTERYDISAEGVTQRSSVAPAPASIRLHWPVLIDDGASRLDGKALDDGYAVTQRGSTTTVRVAGGAILDDARLVTHGGNVREARTADAAPDATLVARVTLEQAKN